MPNRHRKISKIVMTCAAASTLLAVTTRTQADQTTATQAVTSNPNTTEPTVVPMSDAAIRGAGCLALATPIMAAAYAVGPTEIMMLVTGAVIVPSSSTQLLISLGGILGAAACSVGAAITPNVLWTVEALGHKQNSASAEKSVPGELKPVSLTASAPVEPVEPVDEGMMQGAGCLVGVLGISAITLATAPVEIVGLAAGGVTIPTTSASLFLGMAGTVVPAGCSIGAAAALPLLTLSRNLRLDVIGQAVAALFGWGESQSLPSDKFLYMEANKPAISKDSLVEGNLTKLTATKPTGI